MRKMKLVSKNNIKYRVMILYNVKSFHSQVTEYNFKPVSVRKFFKIIRDCDPEKFYTGVDLIELLYDKYNIELTLELIQRHNIRFVNILKLIPVFHSKKDASLFLEEVIYPRDLAVKLANWDEYGKY